MAKRGGMPMDEIKRQIEEQGIIVSDDVLNLDAILNQQVDPSLIMEIGKQFASRFASYNISKVLTIESSGISVAFTTALELGVPLVFARKKKTLTTNEDVWTERVPSFTKGIVTDIVVAKKFLNKKDNVLVIDDIIANGDAVRGLLKIIQRSEAKVVGFGVVMEKTFQAGANLLRQEGIKVESLVKLRSLSGGTIEWED